MLAVLTTCCALVLASGTAGLAAPAPAPRAGAATASSFVIATYNIRHALSDAVATADVTRLAATGVDVIALQEMGSGSGATPCGRSWWTARAASSRPTCRRAPAPARCRSCSGRARSSSSARAPAGLRHHVRRPRRRRRARPWGQVPDVRAAAPRGDAAGTCTYQQPRRRERPGPERRAQLRQPRAPGAVPPAHGRAHREVSRFEATGAAVFATGDFNVNYRRDACCSRSSSRTPP